MKMIFAAIALFLVSLAASAWTTYDATSGNRYSGYGNTINGYNDRTGSSWSTTINGDHWHGFDSKGRSWTYNNGTGNYLRSDGVMCTGKGNLRICN